VSASSCPDLRFAKGCRLIDRAKRATDKAQEWDKAKAAVKLRDKTCVVCHHKASEVHHVIYRSQGGTNQLSNLALLCQRCHKETHAKLIVLSWTGKGWRHERIRRTA
jgi:5-methylcytosine-specific restriction endonuclease McrA